MRRAACFFLVSLMLFLPSCSSGGDSDGLYEKAKENASSAVSFDITADVKADYGSQVYDFSFHFTGNENEGIIEVQAPKSVAGVSVEVKDGKVTAGKGGVNVYMGDIETIGISPACALPEIMGAIKNGYVTESGYEEISGKEALYADIYMTDSSYARVWFDKEGLMPFYAEIISDGKAVIFCTIKEISYVQ